MNAIGFTLEIREQEGDFQFMGLIHAKQLSAASYLAGNIS